MKPDRWAGPATTTGPATKETEPLTSHGHRQRSAPRPRQGQTPVVEQLALPFGEEQLTTAEQFARFDRDNTRVYELLARFARQWIEQTGGKRIGIGALFERLRWEVVLTTSDPDFKLNNNYRPFYARKLMAQEPDLAGLFEVRKSEADATTGLVRP